MPWKFVRSSDKAAVEHRGLTVQKIAMWWEAFVADRPRVEAALSGKATDADGDDAFDLDEWTREHVGFIDPRLAWEYGRDATGGYHVVMTPRHRWDLRPLVQSVVDAAPAVPNWRALAYRPPAASVDRASALVHAETGHGITGWLAAAQSGPGNRIDLTFATRLAATDPAAARRAAAAAARALLGEQVYHQWVGDVDVVEPSRQLGQDRFLLLQRLAPAVAGLAQSMTAALPDLPYTQIPTPDLASLPYKLNPAEAADYPGQADLVVGTSAIPEFRRAVTNGRPFFSSCFSKHGEWFCCLKLDAGDVSMDDRLVRRHKLEEVLSRPLRKVEAARIVGSGTGLRYVYFDLAVRDLSKTVEMTRAQFLQAGLLPERSWLLFHDAELTGEYVGLRGGTPPPPMPDFEAPPPPPEVTTTTTATGPASAKRPGGAAKPPTVGNVSADPLLALDDDPFLR